MFPTCASGLQGCQKVEATWTFLAWEVVKVRSKLENVEKKSVTIFLMFPPRP